MSVRSLQMPDNETGAAAKTEFLSVAALIRFDRGKPLAVFRSAILSGDGRLASPCIGVPHKLGARRRKAKPNIIRHCPGRKSWVSFNA